jgi:hypothetical protein
MGTIDRALDSDGLPAVGNRWFGLNGSPRIGRVAAVVSSGATNELAQITKVRKEARQWSAVDNFCRPFDFADPE